MDDIDRLCFKAKVAIELYHKGIKPFRYAESAIEKVEDLLDMVAPYLHSTILIRLEKLEKLLSQDNIQRQIKIDQKLISFSTEKNITNITNDQNSTRNRTYSTLEIH
jgi:hypothetical protein